MTLAELHKELRRIGIPEEDYYIHGLFGSTDDHDKLALSIRSSINGNEYLIYFKERGKSSLLRNFNSEDEACKYMLEKLTFNRGLTT